MITDKIKNLLEFIKFLYSNIDNFKQHDVLLGQLRLLDVERNKLRPDDNFKHKLMYDNLQIEIEEKFETIKENIINPIIIKAKELNVCDLNNKDHFEFNGLEAEIYHLKRNFSNEDLAEIGIIIHKYIDFRERTNREAFLGLDIFFTDLDKVFKSLFDFFNEKEEKVFEASKLEKSEDLIPIIKDIPLKDERYLLTTFLDLKDLVTNNYKSFQRQIESKGYVICKSDNDTVKIYTPELAVILSSKELPAHNSDTQIDTTINGLDYLNTYIEAFKEGEQHFETEFKVSPNTLYGANAEQYVRDIHLNFFHVQHTGINKGWGYVKKQYPIPLTHKAIKEFGYFSGIVNKVEEQVNKYPRLFATFDKCEHNLPPQQTETETEQETQTENDFALSTIEDWLFEFKEKMNEADYQNLVSALIQYFETGIFPTLSKPIQINGKPNKKLFGWALNRIFKAKGKGVEKELLQFAKQNISLFTDVLFDENNILKSNLYKYFTTQTK